MEMFSIFSWRSRSNHVRMRLKYGRTSSGSSTSGMMAIRPRTRMPGRDAHLFRKAGSSSSETPPFWGSLAMLTCTSTSITRWIASARRESSSARASRSRDCTMSTRSMMYLTLLVCKLPIRCTWKPGFRWSILPISSCTRFSPIVRMPASQARLISSASRVLVTAQIWAPPHLSEASSMRDCHS